MRWLVCVSLLCGLHIMGVVFASLPFLLSNMPVVLPLVPLSRRVLVVFVVFVALQAAGRVQPAAWRA